MNRTFKGPSGRTRKYYWWRCYEYFGITYPKTIDIVHYESTVMAFEQIRRSEIGVTAYAIAEIGTTSPQLLIQITPLCWGIGMGVSDGYIYWRIGPIAMKIRYGPMLWKTNLNRGVDNL